MPLEPDREFVGAARAYGVELRTPLGGRSSDNWRVSGGGRDLVLRRHLNRGCLADDALAASVIWERAAQLRAIELGWPAARPLGEPLRYESCWYSLEHFLPGETRTCSADEKADLLARWHRSTAGHVAELGPRPSAFDPLSALQSPDITELIARVPDAQDRQWLNMRYDQATRLAQRLGTDGSPIVLVHGDLTDWNLHWHGSDLSGVLDFGEATVGTRIADLLLVWRARHDEVLLSYDARFPLAPEEWRRLIALWCALPVALVAHEVRQHGRPLDRWALNALRRTGPVLEQRLAELTGARWTRESP